ncbi:unnamed protein product [Cercopithifilaria johnstoni]|uniref:Uncharacterized protein n=1 Tax=Cercopithifilaria johnstoni TaxID=2874296 RepID=A0A8J2M505_9BILA|nr:unnamed protein product [Cercopithifilaria johnstoni]
MSNRKTESAQYVMLPEISNLGIGNNIPNTSPLVDVQAHGTSEVSNSNNFFKFLNTNSVMNNIFGRGFLAEPVLRDEEESYRYLMALDRY